MYLFASLDISVSVLKGQQPGQLPGRAVEFWSCGAEGDGFEGEYSCESFVYFHLFFM